jgi:aconitate hydratase
MSIRPKLSLEVFADPRWIKLPYSLRALALNVGNVNPFWDWLGNKGAGASEVNFVPARVLMQDLTGVPAIVDLAAMRDALHRLGGDPTRVNPLCPVDVVIDHSVHMDFSGSTSALAQNVALEFKRNGERYKFLKWSQGTFNNFGIVPPGTGICHQVNLEHLSKVVVRQSDGSLILDSVVGTDSHTTMTSALGILSWGVGGIEAESAMLGQPISMVIPEVIAMRLTGTLPAGCTATDLTLKIVQMLRTKNVVGKFVEFFGPALDNMSVADRAIIANMAPEYGATVGFFPIDEQTCTYLDLTGRDSAIVRAFAGDSQIWRDGSEPVYTDILELDLSTMTPGIAGPSNPEDFVPLGDVPVASVKSMGDNKTGGLGNGSVVIAAITSCTNTSNPGVMLAAGLVAKKAVERGLTAKPWVKTSLAPGSQVVADYLQASGLQTSLDALGFQVAGFGCTTCIGNSGPLPEYVTEAIDSGIKVCAVLSGNRNFSGRVHQKTIANWLASPPLVVAYALAGSTHLDLTKDPIGNDRDGKPVYLGDIWPTDAEISGAMSVITSDMFRSRYANVATGTDAWRDIEAPTGSRFGWDLGSTYVQSPPFMEHMTADIPGIAAKIENARVLVVCPDKTTTDHISPAGAIEASSPAGIFLLERQITERDFNQYGARRGNHLIMMRGTYANVQFQNQIAPKGSRGAWTIHQPSGKVMSIYSAAELYREQGVPLVVFAGKECGKGSSRDWAAKGPALLGVRAVVAESFERIHRSNLIGMGVLPLVLPAGTTVPSMNLDGTEVVNITGLDSVEPGMKVDVEIIRPDGSVRELVCTLAVQTAAEIEQLQHGGIMPLTVRRLLSEDLHAA